MNLGLSLGLGGASQPSPGALIDLDFPLSSYRFGGASYGSPALLPGWSFTRGSPGTALDSRGRVITFAPGVPRVTDLGLLVEESRTNLALQSQAFSSASWSKTGVAIEPAAAVAPDGTFTATRIVEDAASGAHGVSQQPTLVAGTAYVQSVFAKAGERTWLLMTESSNVEAQAWFDLATGTVGTVAGSGSPSAAIDALGDGWYRCALRFTPAANAGNIEARPAPADNVLTYTGDGASGLYVWGAQMEAGAFATSYIPTASSPGLRAADVATISGLNLAGPITLFVSSVGLSSSSAIVVHARLSDGGVSNYFQFAQFNAAALVAAQVVVGGSLQVSGDAAVVPGAPYKAAIMYDGEGRYQTATNGTLGASAVGMAGAGALTTLGIGHNSLGSNQVDNYVRRLAVYPAALANTQLQALTE